MDESRTARALRLVAAVATLVVAIVVVTFSWADSGAGALVVAGVPSLAAAPSLVPRLRRRHAIVATWTAAVVVLGWAVLTSLGTGFYFAAPGLLLLVAAIASLSAGSTTRRSGTMTSST